LVLTVYGIFANKSYKSTLRQKAIMTVYTLTYRQTSLLRDCLLEGGYLLISDLDGTNCILYSDCDFFSVDWTVADEGRNRCILLHCIN